MSAIRQREALVLQLAAFAGNEPASSFFEVRPLDRDMQPAPGRVWFAVRDRAETARRIIDLAARANVFVSAVPRTRRAGTADAVETAWAAWVDIDRDDALERLDAFATPPSMIIATGTPGHACAIWQIPVGIEPAWVERTNRRLALALGGDKAATDRARVLRPCSSLNHKTSPPRPVTCVRLNLHAAYTLGEVVGGLPDDRSYIPAPRRDTHAADPSKALDGLVRTVRDAQPGTRNAALYWAACRTLEHPDLDPDHARATLHDTALAAGLSETETAATLRSALDTSRAAA
jgi:hypothetical protein